MGRITFDGEISFQVTMSTIAFEEGETLLHIYCDHDTKMELYDMAAACETFRTVEVSDGITLRDVSVSSLVATDPMVVVLGLR